MVLNVDGPLYEHINFLLLSLYWNFEIGLFVQYKCDILEYYVRQNKFGLNIMNIMLFLFCPKYGVESVAKIIIFFW